MARTSRLQRPPPPWRVRSASSFCPLAQRMIAPSSFSRTRFGLAAVRRWTARRARSGLFELHLGCCRRCQVSRFRGAYTHDVGPRGGAVVPAHRHTGHGGVIPGLRRRRRSRQGKLLPLRGIGHVASAHAQVAVAHAAVRGIAFRRLPREFDVLLRVLELAEHDVGVGEPREGVEVFAPLGQLHACVEVDGCLVRLNVRDRGVLPHAQLNKDVRRHMQGMRGRRSNSA